MTPPGTTLRTVDNASKRQIAYRHCLSLVMRGEPPKASL
jgi:hypothetical protein